MQPQPVQKKKGLPTPIMALLVGGGCFLVAIPIIAILASVAVPMYTRFNKRSEVAMLVRHQSAFVSQAIQKQIDEGQFPLELTSQEELEQIAGSPAPEQLSSFGYEGTTDEMQLAYYFSGFGSNEAWVITEIRREGDHFRAKVTCSDESLGMDREALIPIEGKPVPIPDQ